MVEKASVTSLASVSGAVALTRAMRRTGVRTIFSLSGNQIMPIYDACIDEAIRIVHTRHESSTIFMADAHAQLSGSASVALVTAAPGFANALGALYSAQMAESPVVLLSGDSPVAADGSGAFQEFPQSEVIKPFVKMTLRPRHVDDFTTMWDKSVETALAGVPGPVHMALPFDLLNQLASHCDKTRTDSSETAVVVDTDPVQNSAPIDASCQALVERISAASRPLLITGPSLNTTRCNGKLQALSRQLEAPVVSMESPRGLNDPVLGHFRHLCQHADLVVLLGKLPDFTLGFASEEVFPKAVFVLLHSQQEKIEQFSGALGSRLVQQIVQSPAACLDTCLAGLSANLPSPVAGRKDWLSGMTQCLDRVPAVVAAENPQALHPSEIGEAVQGAAQRLAARGIPLVTVCDGGEFGQWAQAFVRVGRRIINGTSGAIGGSLPYTVGASVAEPDAVVIAMLGDGTCGFYMAELETMARERIPAIVVIGNDSCWNAEYQIQRRSYGENRTYACELPPGLRYDQVGAALGLAAETVTSRVELERSLERALKRVAAERLGTVINAVMQRVAAPVYSTPDNLMPESN